MADTNFTRSQGETWRITISLEDSCGVPQQLANSSFVPSVYFSGLATKVGQTSVPIHFRYYPVETKTWGRGSSSTSDIGVYNMYAYIPSDEVGVCSIATHDNRASCESSGGDWTVDVAASLLTTSQMAAGGWTYEIRMADASNPSNLESSKTLLEGTIEIEASTLDISSGAGFVFSTPIAPVS
jgi:hypothetical protein